MRRDQKAFSFQLERNKFILDNFIFISLFLFSFYLFLFVFIFLFLFFLFIFFHVPGCSGTFRNVPECFGMFHVPGFIDGRNKPYLMLHGLNSVLKCVVHQNLFFSGQ